MNRNMENEKVFELDDFFGGPTTEDPLTTTSSIDTVHGEDVAIIVMILILWVGAIVLFFHRWGKIRMLEPYQPKFCESHRPSCALVTSDPQIHGNFQKSMSKYNLTASTNVTSGECIGNSGACGNGCVGSSIYSEEDESSMSTIKCATNQLTGSGGAMVQSTSHSPCFPSIYSSNISTRRHSTTFTNSQRLRQNSLCNPTLNPYSLTYRNCHNCKQLHQQFNPKYPAFSSMRRKTHSDLDLTSLITIPELSQSRKNSKSEITYV